MMDQWLAAIKRHTGAQDAQAPGFRWMTVTSVDPTRPAVKGILQPEGVPSGWFPVAQAAAGAGVTMLGPIAAGTQALLAPELGTPGHDYVVVGFAHSDAVQMPPAGNAPGSLGVPSAATAPWAASECLIVANGSVFRLCANGDIYLRPGSGKNGIDGDLTVNGTLNVQQTGTIVGNLTVDANITAIGDISDLNGVDGTVGAIRTTYNGHTHVDPQGGSTAIPTQQMP